LHSNNPPVSTTQGGQIPAHKQQSKMMRIGRPIPNNSRLHPCRNVHNLLLPLYLLTSLLLLLLLLLNAMLALPRLGLRSKERAPPWLQMPLA
jgi:hypothetical protein